jgi:acetolactate synthase-1/2/3 large subunit
LYRYAHRLSLVTHPQCYNAPSVYSVRGVSEAAVRHAKLPEWRKTAMTQLTGGQALVQSIKREGIETIFGLPGVQLDWAFDALYDERDSIKVYHTRHEQATAYMADGYARSTGRVGACLVVPGPGLLNATAALSTAYACSSQVLCLTGQIQSDLIGVGRGLLHEIPYQLEMLRSVTKWAARAMRPAEIPGLVREAFTQLRSDRARPVALEIPPDVLAATTVRKRPGR